MQRLIVSFLNLISATARTNKAQKQPVRRNEFVSRVNLSQFYIIQENGVLKNYELGGEYVAVTGIRPSFIQLGYQSPNSKGFITLKEPIRRKKFRFYIDFLSPKEDKGGVHEIIFGSKLNEELFTSENNNPIGFKLLLNDNKKTIQYVDSKGNKGQKILLKDVQFVDIYRIIVSYEYPNTKISYLSFYDSKISNTTVDIYQGTFELLPDSYLSVIGSSGSGGNPLKLYNIVGYPVEVVKKKYVPLANEKKNDYLLMIIGGISIVLVLYYLYRMKNKEKKLIQ
ncbi:hypothetical protein A0H76_542 [Hepatospora eriocheir]|uniref:L-type lectin-like domain-containing protein n=1 Tax=Hepatospora eriocheir TaxID=1081669 RepID=A0A1X0QIW2_9MICR|nr:hypothetical protein A0H76_542 [Hepatospora eriocheir]